MDETTITASSDRLVTPFEHAPSAWSMPDDVQGPETPSADILAMPERLSQFVRDTLRGTRWRIHSFFLGMTFALGASFFAQGCTGGGG